jgi:hypothetical protein
VALKDDSNLAKGRRASLCDLPERCATRGCSIEWRPFLVCRPMIRGAIRFHARRQNQPVHHPRLPPKSLESTPTRTCTAHARSCRFGCQNFLPQSSRPSRRDATAMLAVCNSRANRDPNFKTYRRTVSQEASTPRSVPNKLQSFFPRTPLH